MEFKKRIQMFFNEILVEPILLGYMTVSVLLIFTANQLYLEKACKVNLNYTLEICDNMNNHTDVQVEVQKYVSEVQAYNGILQSLPAILCTFIMGPLSDRYGRKPLILIGLTGAFILNLVFLINSFWFYELKVQYLLFECFQDILGGETVFLIGCFSLMADLTTVESRTSRMSRLQAMTVIGAFTGFVIGPSAKKSLGWAGMYLMSLSILVLTTLFAIFRVKDVNINRSEGEDSNRPTLLGVIKEAFKHSLTSVKILLRKRSEGTRILIICFVTTTNIQKFIESGTGSISFMFLYRAYQITFADISKFMPVSRGVSLVALLFVVPLMSKKLRDTTIIMIAVMSVIVAYTVYALNTNPLYLWFVFPLFGLYSSITSITRSILTKLVDPTEIGGVLTVAGVIQAILALASKPFYALVYRSTVENYPATFQFINVGLFTIILVIVIFGHFGLKRLNKIGKELEMKSRVIS